MQVKDVTTPLLSGKIGNLIYYVRGGKQYVRRAAIPGKKRKWEVSGRTPKQKAVTGRFSIVQAFYSSYRRTVSPDIWTMAARREGKMAHNLFYAMNCGCFNGEGELVDFEKFHFAYGELLLPRKIRVEAADKVFQVSWEEERMWDTASPDDQLCVGLLYESLPLGARLAPEVSGERGKLSGKFTLDPKLGDKAHVYCFFRRKDGHAFSDSWYAGSVSLSTDVYK
ncbi:hypothetical protein [Odoribacter lunatus]|uniref:hypothetical protein n=1 Tax=Odoribacter lunatus TaxID=2941335 RepID=UPI00203E1671|nr:hypothetical protein [Odoribacter lunatus]